MNRNGIVHSASDFVFLQPSPDFIAFLHSNRINVINVPRLIRLERRGNPVDSGESLIVLQRVFTPPEIRFFKVT